MKTTRYVYQFEEADGKNKQLFGGKGAGLAEMTRIGIPTPPGFIITTQGCRDYYANGERLADTIMMEVKENMRRLEEKTGRHFGMPDRPLFVSVRSGSAVSMPGMMDTILNIGMNDGVAEGLAEATQNRRFAYDVYRRLIQLFGKVALGLDGGYFDEIMQDAKEHVGATLDTELEAETLRAICERYKSALTEKLGQAFPQDPHRSTILGIYFFGSIEGGGVLTPGMGYLIDRFGFYPSFTIASALVVAVTLILSIWLWGSRE